jgi:hypothetical protein
MACGYDFVSAQHLYTFRPRRRALGRAGPP